METVVKLGGVPEYVLDKLVSLGYFKTRTEALRAGVLSLGKEYEVLAGPGELEAEMAIRKMEKIDSEIDSGKRKTVALDSLLKQYRVRRE